MYQGQNQSISLNTYWRVKLEDMIILQLVNTLFNIMIGSNVNIIEDLSFSLSHTNRSNHRLVAMYMWLVCLGRLDEEELEDVNNALVIKLTQLYI